MLSGIRSRRVVTFFTRICYNMENQKDLSERRLTDAHKLLEAIKREINELRQFRVVERVKVLENENNGLRNEVQDAIQELGRLETANGKTQVPTPDQLDPITEPVVESAPKLEAVQKSETAPKPTKESKPKKAKTTHEKPAAAEEEPIDVGRLDFRIGQIIEVNKHPDADSLYVEKIECGEPNPRTVVSGLVKHIPIEEMQNRLVVILCNLKPAKMRGVTSEAMVMCASSPDKVEILSPPEGCQPGDLVHCDGFPRKPDAQLNPKKKIFETCAPDLATNSNKEACYKNVPLSVPGKGLIVSQTLAGVNVK